MDKRNASSLGLATRYWRLFVNRLAYTMQSEKPGNNGKHYYYKPKDGRRLSRETVLQHVNGQITIGIYAINPETQRFMAGRMGADIRSHNVDHTPMYTAPGLVVDVILEAAQ